MDIFLYNNFITSQYKIKFWSLILRKLIPGWWKIKFNKLFMLYLNKLKDLIVIRLFNLIINNNIFDL